MLISVEQAINRFLDRIGALCALLLVLLVLVITWNVLAGYFFNASSITLAELAWHLYSSIFLLGIPYALKTGAHVRVDLFFENMSDRNRALIDIVGTLLFLIPFCLIVIWSGWQFTLEAWSLGSRPDQLGTLLHQLVTEGIGERSQDPGGLLNRWFIKGVIPFSFLLLLLAAFSFLLHKVNLLLGKENEHEQDHAQKDQAI